MIIGKIIQTYMGTENLPFLLKLTNNSTKLQAQIN